MSLLKDCIGIRSVCEFDKVTIKMSGMEEVVLLRPPTVILADWHSFWGGTHPNGNPNYSLNGSEEHHKAVERHNAAQR